MQKLVRYGALIALTIATVGIAALGRDAGGQEAPVSSPAATPANGIMVEMLAGAPGTPVAAPGQLHLLYRITLAPGVGANLDQPDAHDGAVTMLVERGAVDFVVRAGEVWAACPGRVCGTRPDAPGTPVAWGVLPLDTPVRLEPGDYVVQYADAVHDYGNPSADEPAVILVSELSPEVPRDGCAGGCK